MHKKSGNKAKEEKGTDAYSNIIHGIKITSFPAHPDS
jgi:hypothetical protein